MRPSTNSSKHGASTSGLLSNVFGFFSREIESFVVNAAGGSLQASHANRDHKQVQRQILIHFSQQPPEPGPSGSSHQHRRVKKNSRRASDTVFASSSNPKRGKGSKKDERRSRSATNGRSDRPNEPDAPRTRNEPGQSGSSYFAVVSYPHQVFLKPTSPVPREKTFLKPPPPTMPGSLFPRSPSMVPEFASKLQTPCTRRVPNNLLSPAFERTDLTVPEVHPSLEVHHDEADISSGTFSQ